MTLRRSAVVGIVLISAACADTSSEDAPARGSAAAATATVTVTAEPTYVPRSPAAPRLLLPNLRSLPAEEVQIRITDAGDRELRFTAALANTGAGPLVVTSDGDGDGGCPAGQRHAEQAMVVDADGDASYTRDADAVGKRVSAGCMLNHPTHDHWHFDASASYVLTVPGETEPIAATYKVSFCLRDSRQLGGARWSAAKETYGDCERDSIQGVTAGFADVYDTETDGQALPLADDLPDGVYCLTLTADPRNLLRETREDDNAAAVAVRINGTQATGEQPAACAPPP